MAKTATKPARSELLRIARALGIDLPEDDFAKLLDRAKAADDPEKFIREFAQRPAEPSPAMDDSDETTADDPVSGLEPDGGDELDELVAADLENLRQVELVMLQLAARVPGNATCDLSYWNGHVPKDARACAVFRRSGLSNEELYWEFRRCLHVVQLRPHAGTASERKAFDDAAEKAAAALAEEGSTIQRQRDELMARLDELRHAASQAANAAGQRRHAVSRFLESCLPSSLKVLSEPSPEMRSVNHELLAAKGELQYHGMLLNGDESDPNVKMHTYDFCERNRMLRSEKINLGEGRKVGYRHFVDEAKWAEHKRTALPVIVSELQKKVAQLSQRLEGLRCRHEARQKAAIDAYVASVLG